MRIDSLEIKRLYGTFNYNVRFNADLTFLYGTNGCGKTTILNIIEAIISGRVYDLFTWDFERICLKYCDNELAFDNTQSITISYNNENLCVTFKGNNKTVKKDDFIRCCDDADSYEELFHLMRSKYSFLDGIKKEFNYVYLPLYRNSVNTVNSVLYRKFLRASRYRYIYGEFEEQGFSREEEIGRAVKLVQKSYMEASARVTSINDEFRNSVLKSLLGTNAKLSNENFISFIIESTEEANLDTLKGQYFKLLASLELLDKLEKEKYDLFFNEYKEQARRLNNYRKNESEFAVPVSLIYEYHEIEKIKTVIPLAQEAEEKKAEAFSRINLFVDTMNSFIYQDDSDKKLYIDETGKIKFLTGGIDTNISANNLSSGEKQLLIFFANLVFNVDESASSIFVVDEPELSLHLSWQKMFVEKAMQVNKNMQLIFATHAPEIVGANRKKMVKLQKTIHQ